MASPFSIFRKHQRILMGAVTLLSMLAFVFLGSVSQMSGQAPTSLLVLLAAVLGGGLLWFIGAWRGHAKEYATVGALIAAAAVLVALNMSAPAAAVETRIGNFTQRELSNLRQRRQIANQFLYRAVSAAVEGQAENEFQRQALVRRMLRGGQFGFGRPSEEQDVLFGALLRHKAREMGVVVSDRAVTDYIRQVTNGRLSEKEFRRIRGQMRLSESDIYNILREQLQARLAFRLLVPQTVTPPESYWDYYRRLNVTQELDVVPLPVEEFTSQVPEPERAELVEFFERYKTVAPNEQGKGTPGFRQPRRIELAYVEAVYDEAAKEVPEITEEEVEQYYEENKEMYRNAPAMPDEEGEAPALPGGGAGASSGGNSQDEPLQPELTPERGGSSEPARGDRSGETPADEQPADKKPGDGASGPAPDDGASADRPEGPDGSAAINLAAGALVGAVAEGQPPAVAANPQAKPQTDDGPVLAGAGGAKPAVALKPGEKPAGDTGESVPEFRPLDDELRTQIREDLRRQKTLEAMRQKINRAINFMHQLGTQKVAPLNEEEALTHEEVTRRLKKYAEEHGLHYGTTPRLSAEDFPNTDRNPLGGAVVASQGSSDRQSPTELVAEVFESSPERVYSPGRAEDPITDSQYAYWKIEDKAEHVPEFDDTGIEEQVREAWKRSKARPLARERAEKLKEVLANGLEDGKKPSAVLDGKTVTGKPDGRPLRVLPTESFSWMRTSSAAQTSLFNRQPPELTDISVIEGEDREFMQTVFKRLDNGDVGVVPNLDRTIVYVVRVKNRKPATEEELAGMRKEFLDENLFGMSHPMIGRMPSEYEMLAGRDRQELLREWIEQFESRFDVRWNAERTAPQTAAAPRG